MNHLIKTSKTYDFKTHFPLSRELWWDPIKTELWCSIKNKGNIKICNSDMVSKKVQKKDKYSVDFRCLAFVLLCLLGRIWIKITFMIFLLVYSKGPFSLDPYKDWSILDPLVWTTDQTKYTDFMVDPSHISTPFCLSSLSFELPSRQQWWFFIHSSYSE
jgi:hypothetical protein